MMLPPRLNTNVANREASTEYTYPIGSPSPVAPENGFSDAAHAISSNSSHVSGGPSYPSSSNQSWL